MLTIDVLHQDQVTSELQQNILSLCRDAYGTDLGRYYASLHDGVHVLGSLHGVLVSHAMWVERTLIYNDRHMLNTAYVELVATRKIDQRRGFAHLVLSRLAQQVSNYDLAALSPATYELYTSLGWILWQGPLWVRQNNTELPADIDEVLMALELPNSPGLDTFGKLSIEWREGEIW